MCRKDTKRTSGDVLHVQNFLMLSCCRVSTSIIIRPADYYHWWGEPQSLHDLHLFRDWVDAWRLGDRGVMETAAPRDPSLQTVSRTVLQTVSTIVSINITDYQRHHTGKREQSVFALLSQPRQSRVCQILALRLDPVLVVHVCSSWKRGSVV